MPPRWMSLGIVAFWLTTSAWLFRTEFAPSFQPDQPPPYSVEMAEEAQTERAHIRWTVSHNGHNNLRAETWVAYREQPDDSFALNAIFKPRSPGAVEPVLLGYQLKSMNSLYRITRESRLLEIEVHFNLTGGPKGTKADLDLGMSGVVRGNHFYPEIHLPSPLENLIKPEPVPVSFQGMVFLPLHPVNQIRGLRPGQTWTIPLVDPLGDSLAQLGLPGGGTQVLRARVLPETEIEKWNGGDQVCFVIEFRGEETRGRTLVQKSDGLVLRQEVNLGEEHWVLQREAVLATNPQP